MTHVIGMNCRAEPYYKIRSAAP